MPHGYKTLNNGNNKEFESISINNIKTKIGSSHPNKLIGLGEFETGDVISGKRALYKAQEL